MKLKDILELLDNNLDFNIYVRGIKLINNRTEEIPRDLRNAEVEKIGMSELIDVYIKD